jgi:signal transduction histidine kinase
MVWLYTWFHDVSYLKKVVQVWEYADTKVAEFYETGQKIHELIDTSYDSSDVSAGSLRDAQLSLLMQEVGVIDDQLTIIESEFSMVLGQASRAVANILLAVSLVLGISLGVFVLVISLLIVNILIKVDGAKTEFVSWASHQLRTPATAVKWRSQAILNDKNDVISDKQRDRVKEIYDSNERMIKLIGNLLNATHIEMGKFKVIIKQVDINALLKEVIKEQQSEIEKRKQIVKVIGAEQIPLINSDPVLLNNIFQNILSNAIKYTPDNGQITCIAKIQENKLLFEFKDNGIGIPGAEQKRIFEKTFRASNALEKSPEGNGLGMYIIKGMAKALGGKIWFESKAGEGTTFFVELPLA